MSVEEITKLRIAGKNDEAVTKGLQIVKQNLRKEELIQLLDELIITSWYCDKKNVGINAAAEIDQLICHYGINLTDLQKSNMKYVVKREKSINFKDIPFIFGSGVSQDLRNEYTTHFESNNFLEPIFLSGGDSSLLTNFIPPYVYVCDKVNISQFSNNLNVEYFSPYIKLENCILIMKKNSYKYEFLLYKDGIKSWDVFDTLIGRKCHYPSEIFKLVQMKSNINNFHEIRTKCERSTLSTYDDIYDEMKKYLSLNEVSMLKDMEFNLELENTFPIQENIDKVNDGDILVSDNYYSEDKILKLLKKSGLNKNIKLYVTYSGKSSGNIWSIIKQNHIISSHTGDNIISDVKNPIKHGILGIHYDPTYNDVEKLIDTYQPYLARYARMLRLRNVCHDDVIKKKLWNFQANYNIPILLILCKYLNEYCIKNGYKKLLFCTRDCCLLIKIFKHFYKDYECVYFHSSRIAYGKMSTDYVKYVESFYNGKNETLVIDICGTGKSGKKIFEKLGLPKRFYLLYLPHVDPIVSNIDYIVSFRHCCNSYIEILNYDTIGCLEDVKFENDEFVDIRQKIKYDISMLDYHEFLLSIIKSEPLPEMNIDNVALFVQKLLEHLNPLGKFLVETFNHSINE